MSISFEETELRYSIFKGTGESIERNKKKA